MNYKKIIYSCFALLFPCTIFCQTFNYNEYAFPDMNIKGMYLTGNSIFQNNTANRRFSATAISGQFTLKNTRRIQRYYRNHFELFYANSARDFNGNKDNNDHFSINGTSYYEIRKFKPYQKRRKAFFKEFNHLIDFSITYSPQSIGNFDISRDVKLYTSFPLKIGIGKIEPVAHLNVAEFLAEDLFKEGLIDHPLDEDDIRELSEKIVSVTNERVFDRRNAYIYQLTEISNWFHQRNIPNTVKSFTILNDNLLNVDPGIPRGHGIQNSFWIEPILLTYGSETNNLFFGMGMFYSLNIQKYFSKHFHHDFRFKTGIEALTYADGFLTLSTAYNLNLTPNSRTIISLISKADYYSGDLEIKNFILSFAARISYFINYKLRLVANIAGNRTYHPEETIMPYTLRYDGYAPVFYRTFNDSRPYYFNASSDNNFIFGNISLNYFLF